MQQKLIITHSVINDYFLIFLLSKKNFFLISNKPNRLSVKSPL